MDYRTIHKPARRIAHRLDLSRRHLPMNSWSSKSPLPI